MKSALRIFAVIFTLIFAATAIANIPTGPTILYNSTETANMTASTLVNTSGGSFTTMVLNVSNQNSRWKAYVGNVTGKLTLDDSSNKTIYDWSLSSVTGNVYASRNSSVDWSGLVCADRNTIYSEEAAISMVTSKDDSINSTFVNTVHKEFYAANNHIQNSTCPAIATYVNDAEQTLDESAKFQEILLKDSASTLIYTTIIEPSLQGFDNNPYDFQMILADDDTTDVTTPYYFYVELT